MRLTYTDYWSQFLRNTNQVGLNDTNVQKDFQLHLGQRYQLMLAKLKNYRTESYYAPFLTGMNVVLLSTGVAQAISSITSSGTTATVTTIVAHGYSTGNSVNIMGAALNFQNASAVNTFGLTNPNAYNGTYTITVTDTTHFTYTLASNVNGIPAMPAQYFPYPQGNITIDGIFITVGAVNFPLQLISTTFGWEELNAILIQASALPQFYFPRRDDFGIWPVPQSTYQGTILYHYRDRNLMVDDYLTGTVTMTQNSNIVLGSGTTFTAAMVGRWLTITDTTVPGQGYWFRILGYTDATHVTIDRNWPNATTSSVAYRIGESPELPEEGHIILSDGVTADYYGGMRKDQVNYKWYSNLFWTGDPGNDKRQEGNSEISAGLIGLVNRYMDRDDVRVIQKRPKLNPLQFKAWATSLSSSG
ncbi:MAG: hypothetical protein KGI72_05120 [Patescibacteria group bacterium]|nr:hypothetical protein [Patescibacteria group bacterium]MDE2015873.1 hypothetical protein [Patescibacteria group bacterium]MDE2233511.1 hypothetical protein [Patescibacteria group bacterium]